MVVRRWRLVVRFRLKFIVLRRNGGAIAAVAWCVSGVSNPDFPNFTKHSTVLTSILQQISTLYQHFTSAETALTALEQAKTMLKIALPTFKNDENHTQNSKIHIQNSVCEVHCGENSVRKRQNCGVFSVCTCLISCIFVAKVAKWWCDGGGWWCGCGVFVFGFFMI